MLASHRFGCGVFRSVLSSGIMPHDAGHGNVGERWQSGMVDGSTGVGLHA